MDWDLRGKYLGIAVGSLQGAGDLEWTQSAFDVAMVAALTCTYTWMQEAEKVKEQLRVSSGLHMLIIHPDLC